MKPKYSVTVTSKSNKHYQSEMTFISWSEAIIYIKAILDIMEVIKDELLVDVIYLNTGEVVLTNDNTRQNHTWSGAIVSSGKYFNRYHENIDFDIWSEEE